MASPGLYTADPERDMTAELERRVVEVNKAFAGWVMASWEMCPTHEWTGAAQEYCNKITKLAKEYSSERGGTDLHLSSASNAAGSRHAISPTPPFSSTTGAANASLNSSPNTAATTAAPSVPLTFGSGAAQPHTTPTAAAFNQGAGALSPTVPGPIPCESPNKGGSNAQRQPQPHAPVATPPVATTSSKPATSRKRRATEDPEGAPNAHNPPKPPMFSSIVSNEPTGKGTAVASGGSEAPSFSFGAKSPAPAAAATRTYGKQGGTTASGAGGSPVAIPKPPLFGSLFATNGGDSASSAVAAGSAAAAEQTQKPASSKPFAALFGKSDAASSSGQPLFGSSAPAAASSPGTGGGMTFGGGFGGGGFGSTTSKADGNVAGSFTFGTGAGTPVFGAGGGFGGGAGVMASVSTPTFGTLGGGNAGASAPAAAASAPAEEDGAEKEPVQKVELKGDDKTDIQFSGKTSFRFMLEGKWGDGTVGALTIRKDKASGKSWLQVNNESKGNILLYAAFITSASATVTEAKGVLVLSLNVFKYPPGKEPNKTVDDGKGGKTSLPEKEENPISAKNVMFKVKADKLPPLLDTLDTVGIKCNKK